MMSPFRWFLMFAVLVFAMELTGTDFGMLRNRIDLGTANVVIYILTMTTLLSPIIGAIGGHATAVFRGMPRCRGTAVGLAVGCIGSGLCVLPFKYFVSEYWAG